MTGPSISWRNRSAVLVPCLFCMAIGIAFIEPIQNGDVMFMSAHGRDMVHNGLTRWTDVFSLHDGFAFMHQKWAMCVLVYVIDILFGLPGLFVCMYAAGAAFGASLFLGMCRLNGRNPWSNFVPAAMSIVVVAGTGFLSFRPHVFACMFLVWEICVLEDYAKGRYDGRMPMFYVRTFVISVLVMWFHSTMWMVVLVAFLPYLAGARPFAVAWSRLTGVPSDRYRLAPLLFAFFGAMLGGACNPNGILQFRYMSVCLQATGEKYGYIPELQGATLWPVSMPLVYAVAFVAMCAYVAWQSGAPVSVRHICFAAGSIFMLFIAIRMVSYSAVFLCMAYASAVGASKGGFRPGRILGELSTYFYAAFGCACLAMFMIHFVFFDECLAMYGVSRGCAFTGTACADAVDSISWDKGANVFTVDLGAGSYAIRNGLRPYVDNRAEVYDTSVNGSFDVLTEFMGLRTGTYQGRAMDVDGVMDLQERYGIDYWLVQDYVSSPCLDVIWATVKEYGSCVYEDEACSVYAMGPV